MRDLHYDADFMRDFAAASQSWQWATWHQVARERDDIAQRLLRQVFGPESEDLLAGENDGHSPAE